MIKSEVKDNKIDLNTKMKAFYGMERQENDTNTPKNLVRDIIVCPICNEKLEYDYIQLNHHGKCRCRKGHLTSPNLDTRIIEINSRDRVAKISIGDRKYL